MRRRIYEKILEIPETARLQRCLPSAFAENGYLFIGASGPCSPGYEPQSKQRFEHFKHRTCRITRYKMEPDKRSYSIPVG